MRKLVSLIITLIFCQNLWCQVIHFDKPYYFAGEYIFYSLNLSRNLTSEISTAITFYSREGQISKHHHLSENGIIQGYIKLPFSLKSDQYLVEIHLFEKDQLTPILIFDQFLPIYNDTDLATLQQLEKENFKNSNSQINSPNLSCSISSNDERPEITCSVTGIKNGVYSIAVKEAEIPVNIQSLTFDFNAKKIDFSENAPILGKRTYESNNQINNPLILSILPADLKFSRTLANEKGNFALPIPLVYGTQKIQFYDHLNAPFEIKLDPAKNSSSREFPKLMINQEIIEQLQDYQKRKLIYQLYNQLDQNIEYKADTVSLDKIKPDYELWVADYDVKGSLGALFVEVFTPLKYKKTREGLYEASMMYEQGRLTKFYDKKTLFIINSQLTTDDHFIGSLPIHLVEKMRIYSKYDKLIENFGKGALRGIVEIDMKDPSYIIPDGVKLPEFEFTGYQKPAPYPLNFSKNSSSIPQLRPLLYWNPNFNTANQNQFSFNVSDDLQNYRVELIGTDPNGNAVIYQEEIKLKEEHK